MKKIQFISGLPRSGSTLLCNMLAMSDQNYVTPTSNLNPLVTDIRNGWHTMILAKSEGLEKLVPHIRSAIRGFMLGYFDVVDQDYIWDKNRAWPNEIELLEDVLRQEVRIIYPIRPIEEILASFEKIHSKCTIIRPEVAKNPDVYKRINLMLDDNGVVGSPINIFHSIFQKKFQDRVMFVPYKNIVNNPIQTLKDIHDFCDVPFPEYDISDLKHRVKEDDTAHVFMPDSLHGFNPNLKQSETNPFDWLPSDAIQEIRDNPKYKSINDLAG